VLNILAYFILGVLCGILYSEHIYRQAKRFPAKHPFFNFMVRFSSAGLFFYLILKSAEGREIIFLLIGLTMGILLHAFVRGFILIKY